MEMRFRSRLRVEPGMRLELEVMWWAARDGVAGWDKTKGQKRMNFRNRGRFRTGRSWGWG